MMKQIAPDYYDSFKCIAEKCRHNCCIGWEIDIDNFTLDYYNTVEGEMGDRLKKHISLEGDAPHFCMGENERCPFLNEKNLCDIISDLGDDALCDICADHPRFRNYFSHREEIGLGLCCESAGRLILGNTKKVQLVCLDDDGEKEYFTPEEEIVLLVRKSLFSIVQNREKTISERIKDLLEFFDIKAKERKTAEWTDIFLSMERLDEKWTELLLKMKNAPDFSDALLNEKQWETVFEQLLHYFIYRQFSLSKEDGKLNERLVFSVESCLFISRICAFHKETYGDLTLEDIVEYARMYSAEMEYSEENVEKYLKVTAVETYKV